MGKIPLRRKWLSTPILFWPQIPNPISHNALRTEQASFATTTHNSSYQGSLHLLSTGTIYWCYSSLSHVWLCDPKDCSLLGSSLHWEFSRQEYWSGLSSLPQRIFPTQDSNPGLPRCGQILYHLSHWGSPRILEWLAYPFSRGSSQPSNPTGASCIAGGFFTGWVTSEALGGAGGKESACQCRRHKRQVWSLGGEDPLEWEMETFFIILAWKIAWTKKPGGLQYIGPQRVGHK